MTEQSAWEKFRLACGRFGRKTGDAVSIQKMKLDISEIRDEREKDYAALGRLCYKDLKTAENLEGEVAELVAAIHEKNVKVRDLKNEIAAVQNKRYCPKCNALLESDANFCSNCGHNMTCPEVLQAIEEDKEKPALPEENTVSNEEDAEEPTDTPVEEATETGESETAPIPDEKPSAEEEEC